MNTPASRGDRVKLIEFLEDVEKVLKDIVDARSILFRRELRASMNSAWQDVTELFVETRGELDDSNASRDEALGKAGLSGSQLDFKIKGFRGALDRFRERGTLNLSPNFRQGPGGIRSLNIRSISWPQEDGTLVVDGVVYEACP